MKPQHAGPRIYISPAAFDLVCSQWRALLIIKAASMAETSKEDSGGEVTRELGHKVEPRGLGEEQG